MEILKKVRKARKTGLNKKLNRRMGSISLDNKYIGQKVYVVSVQEYRITKKVVRNLSKTIERIKKILK